MAAVSPTSAQLAARLHRELHARRPLIAPRHRALVATLCMDAIGFAGSFEPPARPGRAEATALMLLELALPDLHQLVRQDLAGVCRHVVTPDTTG